MLGLTTQCHCSPGVKSVAAGTAEADLGLLGSAASAAPRPAAVTGPAVEAGGRQLEAAADQGQ